MMGPFREQVAKEQALRKTWLSVICFNRNIQIDDVYVYNSDYHIVTQRDS